MKRQSSIWSDSNEWTLIRLFNLLERNVDDVLAIYAFGSRVQNQDNAQSDLDLAVLLPKPIPPLTIWEIANSLSGMVNCPVDLIDLRSASTVMPYQIVSTGIRLWEKKQEGQLFEVFVCNDKLDLDARRKDLLNDIQQSGRVYTDDVLINKAAIIERCVARAREEYAHDPIQFETNFTRQDAAILNIQRACEATLDMGQI